MRKNIQEAADHIKSILPLPVSSYMQPFNSTLEVFIGQMASGILAARRLDGGVTAALVQLVAEQFSHEVEETQSTIESGNATAADIVEALWLRRIGADSTSYEITITLEETATFEEMSLTFHDNHAIIRSWTGKTAYTYIMGAPAQGRAERFAATIFLALARLTAAMDGYSPRDLRDFGGRDHVIKVILDWIEIEDHSVPSRTKLK